MDSQDSQVIHDNQGCQDSQNSQDSQDSQTPAVSLDKPLLQIMLKSAGVCLLSLTAAESSCCLSLMAD